LQLGRLGLDVFDIERQLWKRRAKVILKIIRDENIIEETRLPPRRTLGEMLAKRDRASLNESMENHHQCNCLEVCFRCRQYGVCLLETPIGTLN